MKSKMFLFVKIICLDCFLRREIKPCHYLRNRSRVYLLMFVALAFRIKIMKVLFITVLGSILQQMTVSARSTYVDVASDMQYSWRISGNYFYSPKGSQLSEFPDKFPRGFDFKSISHVNGVWSVFPTMDPVSTENNETLWTNKVVISFASSAQLMDSLTIWHNSGGHAIINVIVNGHNYTQTPESMFSGWVSLGFQLEGKSQFTIEAITTKPGDYILIDKIQATFMDTTTSTHRPRPSTTKSPKPSSKASRIRQSGSSVIYAALLSLYAAKLFK